ncbi:P27 family phage terminase small subunit [Kitasatospora sp. NPDC088351]|uniref:P27 family phage terminase small subunit n=1 Tax=unclassified Kitasatospora TaxID=2633591 RepID=UPI003449D18D
MTSDTSSDLPPAPGGLGQAGTDLWEALRAEGWELSAGERAVLADACALRDEVEAVRAALTASGPVVTGSAGQPAAHPLFGVLDRQRAQFARLVGQLGVTLDGEAQDGPLSVSQAGRAGARARWGVR